MSDYSLTKTRTLQWATILLILISGTGAYFYFRSKAAGTMTTSSSNARPDFEAPLKSDLNLTAGTGTATYSRADGADGRATITDFEGLIRPVRQNEARFEGARRVENCVSKSEDFSGWTKGGTATVTGQNTLNFPAVGDYVADTAGGCVSSGVAGEAYRMSVVLSGSGTVFFYGQSSGGTTEYMGGSAVITLTTTPKRYSVTGTTSYGSHTKFFFVISRAGGTATTVTATNAQIENVTGQSNQNPSEYVSVGVKTAFPYHGAGVDGVKYFDYQNGNTVASNVVTEATGTAIPEATLKGYLAEGSRTNLYTYSEQFDNAAWTKTSLLAFGSGSSANAVVSPAGTMTAEKIVEDTSTFQHKVSQSPSLTAGNTYTVSVFAKAAERTVIELYAETFNASWTSTGMAKMPFNLSTISTGSSGQSLGLTHVASSIVDVGNGWRRCNMTFSIAGGTDMTYRQVNVMLHNGTSDYYLGDGASGAYVWGAQFEQALFASSYIPTTSAAVTRATDTLGYPETGNSNDAAGAMAADVTPKWNGGSGWAVFWLDDSGTSQHFSLWHWNGSANHVAFDRNGNGGTHNNHADGTVTLTDGVTVRIAGSYSSSAVKVFYNGTVATNASPVLPYEPLVNNLYIGRSKWSDGNAFSSIKNVRVWKQTMSDTFLQNLTTGKAGTIKQSTGKAASKNGLVGYWSFEDGSGTKATDFSGNGNTGTLINGPTWTDGRFGKALLFSDSVNNYVDLGSAASLNTSSALTYSVWLKRTASSTYQWPVMLASGGDSHKYYGIRSSSFGDSVYFEYGNAPYDGVSYSSVSCGGVGSLPLDEWRLFTVTYDGTTIKCYRNGVFINQSSSTVALNPSIGTVSIGGGMSGSKFAGSIDDVRIYNRALSQDEVTKLYQATATKVNTSQNDQLTNGLVAEWSFNGPDISGTTAYDRSGQGNNGTLTNGPAATIGRIGQALSFDGTDDYVYIPTSASLGADFFRGSDWTISMWANPTLTGDAIQELFLGVWHKPRIVLGSPNGNFGFNAFIGSVYTSLISSTGFFSANTWTHFAITSNGTNYILYKDGSQVTSVPYQQIDATASSFRIGIEGGNVANHFNGKMDDTRIYNRALSASEVTALYNMGR